MLYVSFIYREPNRDQRGNANSAYKLVEYSGYVLRRYKNGAFLLVDKPTKVKETRNVAGELTAVEHNIGSILGYFEPLGVVRYFDTPVIPV